MDPLKVKEQTWFSVSIMDTDRTLSSEKYWIIKLYNSFPLEIVRNTVMNRNEKGYCQGRK